MPLLRFALPALTVLALGAAPASAQVFETLGTRALGMGGAFVAVADDATAVYWNPAGLATGTTLDVRLERTSLETGLQGAPSGPLGLSAGSTFLGLALPSLGLSYYRLRLNDIQPVQGATAGPLRDRQDSRLGLAALATLTTDNLGVTLVQSLGAGVAVGGTLRWVHGGAATALVEAGGQTPDTLLDQAGSLERASSSTFDADIGVMGGWGAWRAGLVARNLREASVAVTSEGAPASVALRRQVRAGISVTPGGSGGSTASVIDALTIALDVDLTRTPTVIGDRRNVAAGVEQWLFGRRLGVRGGLRGNTIGPARLTATAGASGAIKSGLLVEGEICRSRASGDRSWSVAGRVTF